jgi:hypothetical protein
LLIATQICIGNRLFRQILPIHLANERAANARGFEVNRQPKANTGGGALIFESAANFLV